MKLHAFVLIVLLVIGFLSSSQAQADAGKVKVAIILDDIGAKPTDKAAFVLPREITFSILPNTEYSTQFSYLAAAQNREVMLHMPMESLHGERLGPNPLLATMYPDQIAHSLELALTSVPHAVGVNNHMGSKLTQITLPMRALMQILARSNLFFVDSRTTRYSKASLIADEYGVTNDVRQIFLDHEQTSEFITAQLSQLVKIAQRRGKAIGIAHPYPITLELLPELLQALPSNVQLVNVSKVLEENNKFRIRPDIALTKPQNLVLAHADHAPE